ncbi:MAG: substrate-binding domain-containing protein, partial [Veillonellaceae bacterium]|nr:substrate-binding domain-containing protein [Veillonellaceae bacterium]
LSQWMREQHISASRNRIQVNTTATCVAMVERGLGWGIVPEMCLENFDGIARPLYFENGEPLTRATWLMYQKQALELPQVRVFLDLVRKSNADRQKRDHKDIIPKHQNERKDS